jgi:hypothetical protein
MAGRIRETVMAQTPLGHLAAGLLVAGMVFLAAFSAAAALGRWSGDGVVGTSWLAATIVLALAAAVAAGGAGAVAVIRDHERSRIVWFAIAVALVAVGFVGSEIVFAG